MIDKNQILFTFLSFLSFFSFENSLDLPSSELGLAYCLFSVLCSGVLSEFEGAGDTDDAAGETGTGVTSGER